MKRGFSDRQVTWFNVLLAGSWVTMLLIAFVLRLEAQRIRDQSSPPVRSAAVAVPAVTESCAPHNSDGVASVPFRDSADVEAAPSHPSPQLVQAVGSYAKLAQVDAARLAGLIAARAAAHGGKTVEAQLDWFRGLFATEQAEVSDAAVGWDREARRVEEEKIRIGATLPADAHGALPARASDERLFSSAGKRLDGTVFSFHVLVRPADDARYADAYRRWQDAQDIYTARVRRVVGEMFTTTKEE